MTTSYMKLIANTPCSKTLLFQNKEKINDFWPYRHKLIYTDDYGNEKETTDRTETRELYAKFICALSWDQINLKDSKNRNRVFDCLKWIGNDTRLFGQRFFYHTIKAYENNQAYFTKKQIKILRELININQIDLEYDETPDIVDSSDEEELNAPFYCPSCCPDNKAGSKYQNYECDDCARQTQGAINSWLDDYY